MIHLRPYQQEAIDALHQHWEDGGGNALIVLPTGSGKSLVIATLLRNLLQEWPLMRIAAVTHSKELISQNYQELIRVWPQAPAGIYSAGLGRRDTHHPILFCGIQSVAGKASKLGRVDLVLVDEAHLISRKADTLYGKFFASLREMQPDMRVVGLTATPYRMDSGRLDRGDDRMFEKVVYEANVSDLIEDGYLSPLISKATGAEISIDGVHRRGGEFIPSELEQAAMRGDLVDRAAAEIVARGQGRRAWLAFCTGLDHAAAVRDALRNLGVRAEMVDGSMPGRERDRLIGMFRTGQIKCLTSVNVLSIGFNVPHVDLVALLRPTESAGLYIQQVGRAFRKAQGKSDALVLDFAGNVRRHGPVDMVSGRAKRGPSDPDAEPEEKEIKAKECPNCQTLVSLRTMQCHVCGHEWPVEPKHDEKPDDVDILGRGTAAEWFKVQDVHYYKHSKRNAPDAPPTMRVTYGFGIWSVSCWVCFSHPNGSMPRRKAEQFWIEAGGSLPVPADVDAAIARQGELRCPIEIRHRTTADGFKEITGRRFAAQEAA